MKHVKQEERKRNKKHTFPVKPKFKGSSSVACNINFICAGAGVQVVARVPSAGPVPPPTNVVIPTNKGKTKLCKKQGRRKIQWNNNRFPTPLSVLGEEVRIQAHIPIPLALWLGPAKFH